MSDVEDSMDVDASTIQFSSDNTTGKAKRPVADLPVEVEDNLPWYDSVPFCTDGRTYG